MPQEVSNCILQVEDSEGDEFLLKYVFAKAGITNPVQTVRDGQEAMDYLAGEGEFSDRSKHPIPCLVLLDLKLPKLSGLDVLEWIRRQRHFQQLVVVVFSSSGQPEDVRRAYELGANSYIEKPCNIDDTLSMAYLFKGWWLGFNKYAPVFQETVPVKDATAV